MRPGFTIQVKTNNYSNEWIQSLAGLIDAECSELCKKSSASLPSLFRSIPISDLHKFQWQTLIDELQNRAPIVLKILQVITSHSDSRNEQKCGDVHYPAICLVMGILLKERNRQMCGVQKILSLLLFKSGVQKQVSVIISLSTCTDSYSVIHMQTQSQLNHVNVCLSYNGLLNLLSEVSKLHQVSLQQWVAVGQRFKFVGDNVDKQIRVRDVRSNHQATMHHMYSIIAVRNRVDTAQLSCTGNTADITEVLPKDFLPSAADASAMKSNIVILVARILVTNIPSLSFLAGVVPMHIQHRYSKEMATKSDISLLDVLMENEASHAGMLAIVKAMHSYLANTNTIAGYKVLSGGDQLTRERQACARRHVMDAVTPEGRLEFTEPVIEDWHCMVVLLEVRCTLLYLMFLIIMYTP